MMVRRSTLTEWMLRLALLTGTAILTLVLAEGALRLTTHDRYYVWPPGVQQVLHPDSTLLPGVQGPSRFTINAAGIRGDDFDDGQRYHVLAIGGSTTECLYLDDDEAWPALLQGALRRRGADGVWVGNVGKSGHSTRQHLHQVERLLDQYPRLDAVILLVGINDLGYRLGSDSTYRPFERGSIEDRGAFIKAFAVRPGWNPTQPFYQRTLLWDRLSAATGRLAGEARPSELLVQDSVARSYGRWRAFRAGASEIRDTMPDLGPALEEYRSNLRSIVASAASRGVRVVLVTQPAMYREDLPPELRRLLWAGGVGNYMETPSSPYYSVAALDRGLAAYNRVVLEVCAEGGATCVDLASRLARDTTVMYDDMHFNERGAREVAGVLAQHLAPMVREP